MKVYRIYDHVEDCWLQIKDKTFYESRKNAAIAVGGIISHANMSAKYYGNQYPVNLEIIEFTLCSPVSLVQRVTNCDMTESVVEKLWNIQ